MASGPSHLSHSARETLLRCAKSYFLKYFTPAPRTPALWLAGGSAVHEITEAYDRSVIKPPQVFDVEAHWQIHFGHQLDKLRKADPNEWNWKRSPSEPIERWNVIGPQFVQSYIDWRQRSPYTIWTTPDGSPAIELDVSGYLPGCPVEIKAYVDRVFVDPVLDKLVVVDLKTSKRPPSGIDQFAVYGALLKVKYDVDMDMGVAFMNRTGTLARPWSLAEATPEALGAVFAEAWEMAQAGVYPAEPGPACRLCDVSAACAAKNGPLARAYDPDADGYELPPF